MPEYRLSLFNKIPLQELQETIDHILLQHPDWIIGAICRDRVFVNRSEKNLNEDYNNNIQNLFASIPSSIY